MEFIRRWLVSSVQYEHTYKHYFVSNKLVMIIKQFRYFNTRPIVL
jgi:hypothetical protein